MPKRLVSLLKASRLGLNESNPRKLETGELSESTNIVSTDKVLRPLGKFSASATFASNTNGSLATDYGEHLHYFSHDRNLSGSESSTNYLLLGNHKHGVIDINDESGWTHDQIHLDGLLMPVNDTAGNPYTSFTNISRGNFTASYSGGGTARCGTEDEILFEHNHIYVISFNLTLLSGSLPAIDIVTSFGGASLSSGGAQMTTNGFNSKSFTATPATTDTGIIQFKITTTATNFSISGLTIVDNTKLDLVPSIYEVDGAIRACNKNFSLTNFQPAWYGFINKTLFPDLSSDYNHSFSDWYVCDPLDSEITTTIGSGVPSGSPDGHSIHLYYGSAASGTWSGKYKFYISLIFDDGQELLPTYIGENSSAFSNNKVAFILYIGHKDTEGNFRFNPRVRGARIYFTQSEDSSGNVSNDELHEILHADFILGVRGPAGGEWKSWVGYGVSPDFWAYGYPALYFDDPPAVNTFESINGFNELEESVDISQTGDGWSGVEILNRIAYAWGTKRTTTDGEQVLDHDTIYKSIPNRFDTFPAMAGKMLITKGDGEKIIRCIGFGDNLFVFRENTVSIINVSGEYDTLVATLDHVGIRHPNSVVKTEYGLIWASLSGIYFHNGKQLKNLFERNGIRIIKQSNWESFYQTSSSSWNIIAGYYKKLHEVFFFDAYNPSQGGYVVDVFTSAVSPISLPELIATKYYTNFVNGIDGNLIIGEYDGTSTVAFYEYDDTAYQTNSVFALNDETFDNPGIKKYIYALTIIYKNTGSASGVLKYYKDGEETSPTDLTGSTTIELAVSANWTQTRFTLSSPIEVDSFRLYFPNTGGAKPEIKDIIAEIRTLPNKLS